LTVAEYGAYDLFVPYVQGYEKVSLYDGSRMKWGANWELPIEMGPDTGLSVQVS
jgi:3-mercaptopyruvate sulfurtransferase SseA